jgi:hypothetical protein
MPIVLLQAYQEFGESSSHWPNSVDFNSSLGLWNLRRDEDFQRVSKKQIKGIKQIKVVHFFYFSEFISSVC